MGTVNVMRYFLFFSLIVFVFIGLFYLVLKESAKTGIWLGVPCRFAFFLFKVFLLLLVGFDRVAYFFR